MSTTEHQHLDGSVARIITENQGAYGPGKTRVCDQCCVELGKMKERYRDSFARKVIEIDKRLHVGTEKPSEDECRVLREERQRLLIRDIETNGDA